MAAVQYAASADGVFINWLAVEHKVHASVSFTKRSVGEKRIQFRKLGIATFLLNLIQMQQIGRGFCHTLVLQTNPTSMARRFYEHRGFQKPVGNSLESVPH